LADLTLEILAGIGKSILDLSALILTVINGIMLLRIYLLDRPKLIVEPISPDAYQWFCILPDGEYRGQKTRRYGYLAYIDIANKGLRNVSLRSWRLLLKTIDGKPLELEPLSIPLPEIQFPKSGIVKRYPVLGVKSLDYDGSTMIASGSSTSGWAYYVVQVCGGPEWNPAMKEGRSAGKIVVQSIFGDKSSTQIVFREVALEKLSQMIQGFESIGLDDPIITTQTNIQSKRNDR
jgi:hypothetical protein